MEEKKYEQQLFDDIADYIMEAHSVSVPESKITATGIMNILAEFTTALHPSQPEGDGRLKIQATEIVESFEPMCLKYEDAAKKCAILHYELMIDEESVENISIHGIERIKHYKELIKTIKSL